MNYFCIDYDALRQANMIKKLAHDCGNSQVIEIKELKSPLFLNESAAVRGVFFTSLNNGWLNYHTRFFSDNAHIRHWVVCVLGKWKSAVQDMMKKEILSSLLQIDSYFELVFDETTELEKIKVSLTFPVKIQKECLIISHNLELVERVAQIMEEYLPGWRISACDSPNTPEYKYCDAVMVVGDKADDLAIAPPVNQAMQSFFWINVPFSFDSDNKTAILLELSEKMNKLGWNISDYSQLTSFSSILHEQVQMQISKGEITPFALKSDYQFVIWDTYGLPVSQSTWNEEMIIDFLKDNTVFSQIVQKIKK